MSDRTAGIQLRGRAFDCRSRGPWFNSGCPLTFSLGQDTAELFFEDLRVPASAVLGGEAGVNRGFGMLMGELPRERLLIGVQAAATMEAAFEFTREYVNERKAFGKTIVSTT